MEFTDWEDMTILSSQDLEQTDWDDTLWNPDTEEETYWNNYVVSRQCYTGETNHLFFQGLRKIGTAVQTTASSDCPLEIRGRNLQLSRKDEYSASGCFVSRKLVAQDGSVAAEIFPERDIETRFRVGQVEYTALRLEKYFRFYCNGSFFAQLIPVEPPSHFWAKLESRKYKNLLEDSTPAYEIVVSYPLEELLALVLLSFPILHCPGGMQITTNRDRSGDTLIPDKSEFRKTVLYLNNRGLPSDEDTAEYVRFEYWGGDTCLFSEEYPLVAASQSVQKKCTMSKLPVMMQVKNKQVCLDEVEEAIRNCDTENTDAMLHIAQMLYGRVGIISMDSAIEMLALRMTFGAFPLNYDKDALPRYKEKLQEQLEAEGRVYCNVKGKRVDLTAVSRKILLENHFGSSPGPHKSLQMKKEMGVSDDEEAMRLFQEILLRAKVPGSFGAQVLQVYDPTEKPEEKAVDPDKTVIRKNTVRNTKKNAIPQKLDVHGVLELEYYPSAKVTTHTVIAEGIPVTVTLKGTASSNEELVIKGAGRKDPVTGKTGDAYILVKYVHSRYRSDSLWNMLRNTGMYLLYFLVMAVCVAGSLIKLAVRLVFSKLGFIFTVLTAAGWALWYFILR